MIRQRKTFSNAHRKKPDKQTNKQNTLVKRLEISLRKQTWKRGKNLSKKKKRLIKRDEEAN